MGDHLPRAPAQLLKNAGIRGGNTSVGSTLNTEARNNAGMVKGSTAGLMLMEKNDWSLYANGNLHSLHTESLSKSLKHESQKTRVKKDELEKAGQMQVPDGSTHKRP